MSNQNETNIHNLWILAPTKPDGSEKHIIYRVLNYKTVFWAFCYLFFFLLPLLAKFSNKFKLFIERVGWPLPALWIGSLFITDYVVYHTILKFLEGSHQVVFGSLTELRETNFAFIYCLIANHELSKGKDKKALFRI